MTVRTVTGKKRTVYNKFTYEYMTFYKRIWTYDILWTYMNVWDIMNIYEPIWTCDILWTYMNIFSYVIFIWNNKQTLNFQF